VDYRKTTLPNGLRLLTLEMPQTRSASAMIFFGVGSRYESEAEAGLSHFIEHMCFKGTERRPRARDISIAIEGVGGVLNAGTNQETTHYWARVAHPHRALAMDLLADMLRHSNFAGEEAEKERKVILEEIKITFDNPSDLVTLLLDQTLWPDNPLGRDIAGYKETVAGFTRQDLLAFFHRHYAPNAAVVSVAGNIAHDVVLEEVQRLFGDWDGKAEGTFERVVDAQQAPRIKVFYKDCEQANICLGLPGLEIEHPDRYALRLLNTVLGAGMSSRLFLEIRENRALAYDVHSYGNRFADTGSTVIFAGVAPKKARPAIEAILLEVQRLKDVPVPDDELVKAKEFSKGRLLLSTEDSGSLAMWLGDQELATGRILTVEEVVARIEAVTAADIQRVARALFHQDKLTLAVVGPFKKDGPFASLLKLS
jgi:predicted Zn-dependent peptidase